jgi:hypothetical protein
LRSNQEIAKYSRELSEDVALITQVKLKLRFTVEDKMVDPYRGIIVAYVVLCGSIRRIEDAFACRHTAAKLSSAFPYNWEGTFDMVSLNCVTRPLLPMGVPYLESNGMAGGYLDRRSSLR